MATEEQFANRCLPLLIANQHGWDILNPSYFSASWNGGNLPSDLIVNLEDCSWKGIVSSHFGHGILTWTIPYLFRTEVGFNLNVRGPSNMPKDGIAPLEGIVETDWCVATFTMNWKFTRPGVVTFEKDEPFCMIVPVRRGELAAFDTCITPIENDEVTRKNFEIWQGSRLLFNKELTRQSFSKDSKRWQKHYFQGTSPSGESASQHETKLNLPDFVEMSPNKGEEL